MADSSVQQNKHKRTLSSINRIKEEFERGFALLDDVKPAITFFGSARTAQEHTYYKKTERIARLLSDAGFSIMSGGGYGIMEAANKGAFAGASQSIGLNIELPHERSGNKFQNIGVDFKHFFSRKVMLVKYATAFVVMPGGLGTLDELAEILTLMQTRKIKTVPIILVESAFWAGLIDWIKTTLVAEGTVNADDLTLIQMVDDPQQVVSIIAEFHQKNHPLSMDEEKDNEFL